MKKSIITIALYILALIPAALIAKENNSHSCTYSIYPNKHKQTVWGFGFEIQSDAIGTGNTGMPDNFNSVPHDLTKAERNRFANEMLKGFRYCRIAGGLYWRGLDAEQKYLLPRWPEQLAEIRQMINTAGIEGVSMEYWSSPPYWKANNSYIGNGTEDKYNTLRCFGPDFANDNVYKGDTARFLRDYGMACVQDLKTLKDAGIKTVQWGLKNEPFVSNDQYASCKFYSADDFVRAYVATASQIRKFDPKILLISDTENQYPDKIAKGMHLPEVASLVDAYVVHTVGASSESVKGVHEKIRNTLPLRPWFQNEYEYLYGGASPERCLNTVQHIMNSFQLAENPCWYWIHALKPFKNSEASGYSLGYWRSLNDQNNKTTSDKYERWQGGEIITTLPASFKKMEFICASRPSINQPGLNFNFETNQKATVYALVDQVGGYELEGWTKTDLIVTRKNGCDIVYKKELAKGKHSIEKHTGTKNGIYGAPHALFLEGENPATFKVSVGLNSPIKIRSEEMKMLQAIAKVKPGHWVYNDFNWNAVGSFVKHMPWNCKVIEINEELYNKDARMLAFKRPNGKQTIVISNKTGNDFEFKINTGIAAHWKCFKYTPWDRGKNSLGTSEKTIHGEVILTTLSNLSWEFWEEQ